MSTIKSKILKIELGVMFILTVLSFLAFYYGEKLPDNYLTISSYSSDINFFSYYVTSIISAVGYYTGPWVFVPFIVFAVLYSFLFSKRSYFLDVVSLLTLSLGAMFLAAFFVPHSLGEGILSLLLSNFSNSTCLVLGIFFLITFSAGTFRSSFFNSLKNIKYFFYRGIKYISGIFYRNSISKITVKKDRIFSNFNLKVAGILKGQKYSDEQVFTPVKKVTEVPCNLDTPTKSNKLKDAGEFTSNNIEELPFVAKKRKTSKPETFSDKTYYDLVTSITPKSKASQSPHPDNKYFQDIVERIEAKLDEFGIAGQVINVLKGPVVDTFELELGPGVKVSKVQNSEKDLSMALLGAPIRIVYPMIGRTTVGIEVPRKPREIIYLDEVLDTPDFKNTKYNLPIAMGKNAFGETFVVDLASMPHMLVAGATGAGKSVFINTLLVSLLVKKSPNQMKLILVDPKQLELALYQKLPHLVMPVITDAKTASIALMWACQEMERRYSILKEFGVRNLDSYNQKLKSATPEMIASIHQYFENETDDVYEIPYLVIIVDEFADLILTKAGKEIENNICRLAAKARAAGIHLIIATQRPSVDVITGLIKSNFPTRVSFRVTSSVDSRTILNSIGAEKLLGKGDMLYKHGTLSCRVHSSYVDEEEIEALTDKLTDIDVPFNNHAMDFLENGGEEEKDPYSFGSHIAVSNSSGGSQDNLYKEAVRLVLEHRTASASMLQRRLRIGYNRAANLIEELESKGVVGPAEGSKRRRVLIGGLEDQ